MRILICAVVGILLAIGTTMAQDEAPRRGGTTLEAARHFADGVMQKVGNDEMAGAFEVIAENLPVTVTADEVKRLQAQAMQMRERAAQAGNLLGSSYVKRDIAGDVFARFTYVQKFERTAVVWHLFFYKPEDRWFLHGVSWHLNLGVLFENVPAGAGAGG
jgi:hypothetical protein